MICAGQLNCHRRVGKESGCERSGSRYIGLARDFQRRAERRALVGVPAINGGNGDAARLISSPRGDPIVLSIRGGVSQDLAQYPPEA